MSEDEVTPNEESADVNAPQNEALQRFILSAERYLQWANTPPLAPIEDIHVANLLLLEVYYGLLQLPILPQLSPAKGVRPDQSYQAYFEYRFNDFAVRFYSYIFDPFSNPPSAPVVGDVAEDLTVIYLDLYEGLSLYYAGNVQDALFFWRDSFNQAWGAHLTGCLVALYNYTAGVK
jgi:hypothetical protein